MERSFWGSVSADAVDVQVSLRDVSVLVSSGRWVPGSVVRAESRQQKLQVEAQAQAQEPVLSWRHLLVAVLLQAPRSTRSRAQSHRRTNHRPFGH